MITLKPIIASVRRAWDRIWPWTISKTNTKPPVPKWTAVYQEEFDDYNILIEDGPWAGVVIRFQRLGFIPDINDGLTVKFEYDIINAAGGPGGTVQDLTSAELQSTIIEILKQYLNLGDRVG